MISASSSENVAAYHRSVIDTLDLKRQAALEVLAGLGQIRIIEDVAPGAFVK
jgi:hypothetical protein